LLSAGTLVVGVVLLMTALAAPTVLERAGLGQADGPGWSRVFALLLVGGAGELVVVLLRRRWPPGSRAAADAAVIVGCLAVTWWVWWR
jgi:hypothetical protein